LLKYFLDKRYMRRCLDLARQAEGRTAPNPMVGAVVLNKAGEVVGEGYHHRAGEPHAEVHALNQAGDESRGGTLYVNLEPCCHVGRTPACSKRVIESGVSRVVVGIIDPNVKVAGGGIADLSAAGIEVVSEVLPADCYYLNRGFIKAQTEKLPWLALKMAMTLDGSIADRDCGSRYVSGEAARSFVMDLRNRFDCVLIGANTARLDDPQLTVRNNSGSEGEQRDPLKAVLDSKCSVKPDARIFESGETVLFCLEQHLTKPSRFPSNCRVVPVAASENGQLNLQDCLQYLLAQGVQKILCEGGGELAGALIDGEYVDELYWFIAPKMLVDKSSLRAVASPKKRLIGDAVSWEICSSSFLADDILLHGLNSRHEKFVI